LITATSVDNRYAFFAGGVLSNVVDIFDSLSGMWNTTTLSQARWYLAATSLGNLAFFGGGLTGGNQPFNVVDKFTFKKVLYLNGPFSIPNRTYSPPYGYLDTQI
jgi:hypothetical protein